MNRRDRRGRESDPPVRRDQVMRLLNLYMREADAADYELDCGPGHPTPRFDRAHAALEAAMRASTQAEISAAIAAAQRNGY